MGQPDRYPMIERARATWNAWKQDRLLGLVIRNTGYLFSSNTLGTGLSMVQSIFAARLLGVFDFGVLDNITQFSSTVNRLFSFRMGELVVRYVNLYLAEGRLDRAAAVVKIAAIVEAVTSLLAFAILVLLAPWAALLFAKDARWTPLFIFYGVTILGNLMTETSTGVLQVVRQFRSQAAVNLSQAVLTALIIIVAYFTGGGIVAVVGAYLLGKMILGIGPMVLAWRSLDVLLGKGWHQASLRLLPPWRELAHFAITTNLSATLTLLVRDSERLWVSFFLSPLEAGYYKVAMAFVTILTTPITPFIATTYPELSRSITEQHWAQLRRLLRRVTIISGSWTGAVALGLLVFGPWLIQLYGPEFLPAFPALVMLLLGYGAANILFWNRSLLLAFNRPGYPFRVMLWCGLIKVLLGLWVIPTFGFTGEAALLSAYFVVSVGLIALHGVRLIPKEILEVG
jgi:O-antigen/teichoic acid export membrane protein